MLRRPPALSLLLLLTLCLLVPVTASAGKPGKKKQKPLQLQPLADEIATRGEVTDDMMKVLRFADRCRVGDRRWERGMEEEVPINQLYEQLAGCIHLWNEGAKQSAANSCSRGNSNQEGHDDVSNPADPIRKLGQQQKAEP